MKAFIATVAVSLGMTLAPGMAFAQPMLGEIRFVGFGFAPQGWASCDGQLMSVAQNPDLFALLGNKFGGNGVTTFALPDLRGRAPVHAGQGTGLSLRVLAEKGGAESHTLSVAEMPVHSHAVNDHIHPIPSLTVDLRGSSAAATSTSAAGNVLATAAMAGGGGSKITNIYTAGPSDVSLAAGSTTVAGDTSPAAATTTSAGGGQAYSIAPPYLTLKCIIAIQGVVPVS